MKLDGLETTADLVAAMDPVAGPVTNRRRATVYPTTKGVVVLFEPLSNGGWAAIREPGWTCFGDTPEEAFAALNQKHPVDED